MFYRKQNERRNNSHCQSKGRNIGIDLACAGKKVLIVGFDLPANMTIALGYPQPDQMPITVPDVLRKIIGMKMQEL